MTWLDQLPRREIRFGAHTVSTWRLAAVVGCVGALLAGLFLGALSAVPLTLVVGAGVA